MAYKPEPLPICATCGKSNHSYQRGWTVCGWCGALLPHKKEEEPMFYHETVSLITPPLTEHTPSSLEPEPQVIGGIYMLSAGPFYKIGRTNNFNRRYQEIRLKLPYPVEEVHRHLHSDPVACERHWHKVFKDKRAKGQWFLLNEQDVESFLLWDGELNK